MTMQLFSELQECCGCTACLNICPQKAISMAENDKGFLYPCVDPQRCSECEICKKVCPMSGPFNMENALVEPDVYAIKHLSDAVRMDSSSGGMFTALSDYILDKGGAVYGAAFNAEFEVCHQRALTQEESEKFRGSKYVQSNLNRVFTIVDNDLADGRPVIFFGTPCQTSGLFRYLIEKRVDMRNLYLSDIICHGTPSPKIFKEYINYLQVKRKSEVVSINFRYKPLGWKAQAIDILFKSNKRLTSIAAENEYYQLFLPNIILRDSCYQCPFTNLRRPSDLTIGDFWGINKSLPEFEDEKGVSLVLVNTEKGREILEAVKRNLVIRKSDTEKCMQPNLRQPSVPSPKTKQFWRDYQKYGFKFVLRRYTTAGVKGKIKKYLKRILKASGLYKNNSVNAK